jgi:8-oxo-dGTP pyrophosphatase MutT (NUDIX family)
MNKYLTKIAELQSKKLPYRDRVEIIIRKGDDVLLTKNRNKDSGDTWMGFPGGGLDGLTAKEACINECLEEVGIKIKNIRSLGITHTQEGGMSKKHDRHLKYRGSITKWYLADYDEMDRSRLGADGDSRQYVWRSVLRAIGDVKQGRGMGVPRVDALNASEAL